MEYYKAMSASNNTKIHTSFLVLFLVKRAWGDTLRACCRAGTTRPAEETEVPAKALRPDTLEASVLRMLMVFMQVYDITAGGVDQVSQHRLMVYIYIAS